MLQEKDEIKKLSEEKNINIDYFDDDIMIIDSIKSLVHPHHARVASNSVALVLDGKLSVTFNGEPVVISKNDVIFCPTNLDFEDVMYSPNFKFRAIVFTTRILQAFLQEKATVWDDIIYSRRLRVVSMNEHHIAFYKHYYEMLRLCLEHGKGKPYFNDLIHAILRVAFMGMSGELKMNEDRAPVKIERKDKLFRQFMNLLGESEIKHCNTSYYSDQLNVSAKHLSAVCKKNTGKTASDWIQESVREEVRHYLVHTDMSIKQICYKLGFSTPSFFSKYVKQNFGCTPGQLRHRAG